MTTDIDAKTEARFWSKVDKNGPMMPHMESPCWIWTAGKFGDGYGIVKIRGRKFLTHRIAWMIANGAIPHDGSAHGICVLHRCDVPACCRPDHLFLGTNADNVRDKMIKGRHKSPAGNNHGLYLHPERRARGERVGGAKLTAALVNEIRDVHAASGKTIKILAAKFGVSKSTIHRTIKRKNWQHIL